MLLKKSGLCVVRNRTWSGGVTMRVCVSVWIGLHEGVFFGRILSAMFLYVVVVSCT